MSDCDCDCNDNYADYHPNNYDDEYCQHVPWAERAADQIERIDALIERKLNQILRLQAAKKEMVDEALSNSKELQRMHETGYPLP